MNLKQGTLLHNNKYRIERVLGQGGFGITYLATDVRYNYRVAIKEFFPKSLCDRDTNTSRVSASTDSNVQIVDKLRKKFLKEAEHISKMSSLNIVRMFDVFQDNGTAYYVMEYIEGMSLSDMIKRNGPLAADDAVNYILQIGEGLSYIHSKRINHLDIKPANIMLRSKDNTPIIVDFGLSKQYDTNGNQTSSTPIGRSNGYAPIEQYRDGGLKDFSPETDIYSLAATLYYMLSGIVPLCSLDLINEDLTFPKSIPQRFISPISKAMSTRKTDRYRSVAEFIEELPYPSINRGRYNKDNGLIPVLINDKWGFVNLDGQICIEPQFDSASSFHEGVAAVELNGKYGYVDYQGKFVIIPKFADADDFSEGLAFVRCFGCDEQDGYIDKSGKFIIKLSDSGSYGGEFHEGTAWISDCKSGKYTSYHIDKSGKALYNFRFDEIGDFNEGIAAVEINDKTGFIDLSGNYIFRPISEQYADFSDRMSNVCIDGKYGFIDHNGSIVIAPQYDDAGNFKFGLAPVKYNGKYGYINKRGNIEIPPLYDDAESYINGVAVVRIKDVMFLINVRGEKCFDKQFSQIDNLNKNVWLGCDTNNTWHLIFVFDSKFKTIILPSDVTSVAKSMFETISKE